MGSCLLWSSQAPLEIVLELCRDLRRDKEPGRRKASVKHDDSDDVAVHMDNAKILVVSHDISLPSSVTSLVVHPLIYY